MLFNRVNGKCQLKSLMKYWYYFLAIGIILFLFFSPNVTVLNWVVDWNWYIWLIVVPLWIFFATLVLFLVNTFEKEKVDAMPDLPLSNEQSRLSEEFFANGFVSHGPAIKIVRRWTFLVIPFIHCDKEIIGIIHYTEGPFSPAIQLILESTFTKNNGNLGTINTPKSTYAMTNPMCLRQVIPTMEVKSLLEYHQGAIQFLKGNGISFQIITSDNFVSNYKTQTAKDYREIRKRLFKLSLLFLWRSLTGRTPYWGSIRNQKRTEKQISYILSNLDS